MGLNKVLISGRLPRDPEPIGQTGVKFTVGVNGYNFSTKQRETTWVPCVAFGKTADRVRAQLSAKREIIVEGRYNIREYESQGQKRKDTSVVVDNFEFVGPPPDVGQASDPYGAPANISSNDPEPSPW